MAPYRPVIGADVELERKSERLGQVRRDERIVDAHLEVTSW